MIFLPYAEFDNSVSRLDTNRLARLPGKIDDVLTGSILGLTSPLINLWKGSEGYLVEYLRNIFYELNHRGYSIVNRKPNRYYDLFFKGSNPPWWYNKNIFFTSHRVELARRDPKYYSDFLEDLKYYPGLKFYWPKR